jgi:hypothetical protein
MSEASDSRRKRRNWWTFGLWIALLLHSAMLMEVIIWKPIWLTPPGTQYTLAIYIVLLLIWPMLCIAAVRNTIVLRWDSIIVTIVLAGILFMTCFTLAGLSLGVVWMSTMNPNCDMDIISDDKLRYTCDSFGGRSVFESRWGLPIMWLP